MRYRIVFKEEALRDMRRLSPDVSRRISAKIHRLGNDLAGNVKRLASSRRNIGFALEIGEFCSTLAVTAL
jgi:mRNA-degrading endonuclease RelE of RelBE toxin-antitoxin system